MPIRKTHDGSVDLPDITLGASNGAADLIGDLYSTSDRAFAYGLSVAEIERRYNVEPTDIHWTALEGGNHVESASIDRDKGESGLLALDQLDGCGDCKAHNRKGGDNRGGELHLDRLAVRSVRWVDDCDAFVYC